MNQSIQYLTDEQGERVSVVLGIDEYQRLIRPRAVDADLLTGLSKPELHALAFCQLGPEQQARLDNLLERNRNHLLSPEESAELDKLLEDIDYLNVLKTRARYTLSQQQQTIP